MLFNDADQFKLFFNDNLVLSFSHIQALLKRLHSNNAEDAQSIA